MDSKLIALLVASLAVVSMVYAQSLPALPSLGNLSGLLGTLTGATSAVSTGGLPISLSSLASGGALSSALGGLLSLASGGGSLSSGLLAGLPLQNFNNIGQLTSLASTLAPSLQNLTGAALSPAQITCIAGALGGLQSGGLTNVSAASCLSGIGGTLNPTAVLGQLTSAASALNLPVAGGVISGVNVSTFTSFLQGAGINQWATQCAAAAFTAAGGSLSLSGIQGCVNQTQSLIKSSTTAASVLAQAAQTIPGASVVTKSGTGGMTNYVISGITSAQALQLATSSLGAQTPVQAQCLANILTNPVTAIVGVNSNTLATCFNVADFA